MICLLRLLVKICCSLSVRSLKSFASLLQSTSSGRQKKPNCLSVSLSNCLYFNISYRWIVTPPDGSKNAFAFVWSCLFFELKTVISSFLYIVQPSQSSSSINPGSNGSSLRAFISISP